MTWRTQRNGRWHYKLLQQAHGVGVCQCTAREASSCIYNIGNCEQLDRAANFVACRDLCMVVMEGRARPPRDDDRYSELGLAQRGILSHFLRNIVEQTSRIQDTEDGGMDVILKDQPILAGRARRKIRIL